MNFYSATPIGDLAGGSSSAAIRNQFCTVIGYLTCLSDDDWVSPQGLTGVTQANQYTFKSAYQYDMPASNAVILYRQMRTDYVASKKITTLQRKTVTEADFVVAISTAIMSDELQQYTADTLLLSTALILQMGQAGDSTSSFNAAFSTATGIAFFNRAAVIEIQQTIEAAKGARHLTAISLLTTGG